MATDYTAEENMIQVAVKKTRKGGAIATYIIVLIGLLVAFLIPAGFDFKNWTTTALVMQLPDVVRIVLGTLGVEIKALTDFCAGQASFALSTPIYFTENFTLDLNAWLVCVYAVVTVVAIVCIIPVLAGKKDKFTSLRTAFTLEAISVIVLFIINLMNIIELVNGAYALNEPMLISFGVLLLMGIIQRIMADGGSGVMKLVLFLLMLITMLLAFFSITAIITNADFVDWFNDLVSNFNGLSAGLFGGEGVKGFELGADFVIYTQAGNAMGPIDAVKDAYGSFTEIYGQVFYIAGFVLAAMMVINCFLDMLGIYKKTNKFMLVANQVRYLIEIVAAIVAIVMVFLMGENAEFGIMIIVLAVLLIVGYVLNLIRMITYGPRKRAQEAAENSIPVNTDAYFTDAEGQAVDEDVFGNEYAATGHSTGVTPIESTTTIPATASADAAAQQPVTVMPIESQNVIYNVHPIYNGPTDSFIKTLTNDEKVEFLEVFIQRNKGALTVIPDYKIGGDNTKFFSAVIIYYARVSDLISDGLMDKLFDACNK